MENLENNETKKLSNIEAKLSHYVTFVFFTYVALSLSVFIIPENILDNCKICASFVNFMEQIFPNISKFASVSQIPQVVKFYVSIMWVGGGLFGVWFCKIVIFNNRKLNNRIFDIAILFILSIIFGSFMLVYYLHGYILRENFAGWGFNHFTIYFDTQLKIFRYIGIYNTLFFVTCLCMPILLFKQIFEKLNKKGRFIYFIKVFVILIIYLLIYYTYFKFDFSLTNELYGNI